jgi:predicted acyl esterase
VGDDGPVDLEPGRRITTSAAPPTTADLAVPVSLVSGWEDLQLDQTLEQCRRLRGEGCDVRLIIGPWNHTSIFDKGWPVVFPAPWQRLADARG